MRTAAIAGIVALLVSASSATAALVITSRNIKNGTIQLVDISAKAKKAMRGQRGPRGPQGIQTITEVQGPGTVIPPGGTGAAGATCPAGQAPVSGGFEAHIATVIVTRRSPNGWGVAAQNPSTTTPGLVFAYAYC